MRRIMLVAVSGLGAALGAAQAQVPNTNLGTPQTQPQPGGGVAAGPGAPTSATQAAPASGMDQSRGAPPAGGGSAATGGNTGTGSPSLTPGGAITPGQPDDPRQQQRRLAHSHLRQAASGNRGGLRVCRVGLM